MVERYVRSGVLEASLAVFQQWLTREYAKYGDGVLTTALLRNTADIRSFADLAKRKPQPTDGPPVQGEANKPLTYPFLATTIGSLEIDAHRAGLAPKHFTKGQMIGKSKEQGKAFFESYKPIKISMGAIFETDNFDDVIGYATMLFQTAPRLTLVIRSNDTGFRTEIGVQIDTSLTIPQADLSTPGDPFKFEHTFIVDSYIGIASEMPLIKSVVVNARVAANVDDDVFEIDDLPAIQLQKLNWYELFDKSHANYRYDYAEEREKNR